MIPHDKPLHFVALPPVWHEELARSTRYQEAAQKRTEERRRRKEAEAKVKAYPPQL